MCDGVYGCVDVCVWAGLSVGVGVTVFFMYVRMSVRVCVCVCPSVLSVSWPGVCVWGGMSRLDPLLSLYRYCSCIKYLALCMPLHCLHLMKRTWL